MTTTTSTDAGLRPYVPRLVLDWGRRHPDTNHLVATGTLLSADLSGFTALSERLASLGRAGAEELTDVLNQCFTGMISAASRHGGDVLKFGGDALLIWFDGTDHTARACAAATLMRQVVSRPVQSARTAQVRLKISQGMHSGEFTFFLLRGGHAELVISGRAVTRTVGCESDAAANEILLSHDAARQVDPAWLGTARDAGVPLRRRIIDLDSWVDLEPIVADRAELGGYLANAQIEQIEAGVEGEHRAVTVAFCGFAGADALLESHGPGEVAARIEALGVEIGRALYQHGPHWLASDVYADGGKAILTAGAPSSSGHDENDMLLALRQILDADVGLDVRAGVNRGPVFVGALGSSSRRTFTVMGDAVNLAARLMQKARPGQLIASSAVLDRSATRFGLVELEPFLVKGKSEPIRASVVGRILGERDAIAPSTGATSFAGRDGELGVLSDALSAAGVGPGRAVEIVGEAGIGKSRFVAEFLGRHPGVRVHQLSGGQYVRSTPYLALRKLVRSVAGIAPDADPVEAGRLLTSFVAEAAPSVAQWLPLLAIPFDAEVASTPESDRIAPEFRRAALQRALLELLGAVLTTPGVLVVEDAHWLDDASRELLVEIVNARDLHRWLVLVLCRPGGMILPEGSGVELLQLGPLSSDDVGQLATAIIDERGGLGPTEIHAVIDRAGGNPLFAIELAAAVAEQGSIDALPESLEGMMTSRIDTLAPSDRRLLRDASVLGAVVDVGLLAAALEDPGLTDLRRWEPLDPFLVADGATLRWRQNLSQAAAYAGLSFRRRVRVHRAVGSLIEDSGGGVATAGLLSTHFDRADDHERACRYSLVAGDDARAKYATVEAMEFYGRALRHAGGAGLPSDEVARVAEAYGAVGELLGRYDDADRAFRLARANTVDPVDQVRLLLKHAVLRERTASYPAALSWCTRARSLAGDAPEQIDNRIEVDLVEGGVRYRQGRYRDCVRATRSAADLARQIGERRRLAHALDLTDLALIYWKEGAHDHEPGESLRLYEEVGDLVGQSSVLNNLGIAAYQEGRWDEAVALYERSMSASEQAGDMMGMATAQFNTGEILHDQGRVDEARQMLTGAARVFRSSRYTIGVGVTILHLGRTEQRAGDPARALALFDEALAVFSSISASSLVVDTRVRRVEALVAAGRHDEAVTEGEELRVEITGGGSDPLLWTALMRSMGEAWSAIGEVDRALAALDDSVERAVAVGATYEEAESRRVRAEVLDRHGRPGASEDRSRASEVFARLAIVDREAAPVR